MKENKHIAGRYSYCGKLLSNCGRALRALLVLGLCCLSIYSYSQYADCVGAYPVCGNGTLDLAPQGTGINDFANPNNFSPDCQFTESENVWLRIEIKLGGTLGFDLIPDDLTGPDRDDYDFAIYGPNRPCDDLGRSIRCSSTNPQAANVQAETGMNQTETDTSEGPGPAGNGYIHWLDNVQAGEVYYILIDNFDRDDGFSLNWTGTALLEDEISKEDGGVDLGPDINLCDNANTILDATINGGGTYVWNTGETTAQIEIEDPGEYHVIATNPSGCLSKDTINVTLIPAPIISDKSVTPNNVCEPVDQVFFRSVGTSGAYEWFNPSGTSIGTGTDVTLSNLTATDSGEYTVRVTRDNGCVDEETVQLTIHPLPILTVDGNSGLCEGESATLTASGANTYQWIDPDGNTVSTAETLSFPDLDPGQSGTYQLIGQTEFDCEDMITFNVFVSPEVVVTVDVSSLALCTDERIEVLATSNQSDVTYSWVNPSGAVVSTQPQLSIGDLEVTDSGTYTITVTNETGCQDVVEVPVDIDPSYLFEERVEQCPGTFFEIPQTGERIFQTDTIQIDLLTGNGCDSIYVWDVQFLNCADDKCVGFPTAIAPNGNELNEEFNAIYSEGCFPTNFQLTIFNRWGEKVYETTSFQEGWDGRYEDELAQQGFFLFEMTYTFPDDPDNSTTRSGGFTLVR